MIRFSNHIIGQYLLIFNTYFVHGFTAPVDLSFLVVEVPQSHSTPGRTPLNEYSARRTDLYLTTYNTHPQTDIHAPGGIRNRNPIKRGTADLRLRPRDHQ